MRRFIVAAVLCLLLAPPVLAQVVPAQWPPNPGVLPGGGWKFTPKTTFSEPPGSRWWVNGTYQGNPGAKITHTIPIQGPAGQLTVDVGRSATKRAIGKGAANALKSLPYLGLGITLWELWDEFRIRPSGDGGLLHDAGGDPETVGAWNYSKPNGGPIQYPSKSAAVDAYVDEYCATSGAGWNSCVAESVDYGPETFPSATTSSQQTTVFFRLTGVSGFPYYTTTTNAGGPMQGALGTLTQCPASVDPLNPAYSIPAGEPVDDDGKCRRARYFHDPISVDDAADRFRDSPDVDPKSVAEDVTDRHVDIETSPEGVSGPSNTTGTPQTVTTTNPDGGTVTTTTTPTYNYNYGGDTINWTITTTTVTVDNSTGDTTTVVTGPPPPVDEFDPEDPCVKRPDSLACLELGEPPTDDIPKADRSIDFSPESFGSEACPPPVSLPGGRSISYQPLCDGLVSVRPLIIALGFLMAGGIVVAALRGHS